MVTTSYKPAWVRVGKRLVPEHPLDANFQALLYYQAMVEILYPSLRELKAVPYSRRIEELLRLVRYKSLSTFF